MKLKLLLLFFLSITAVNAQQLHLTGKVVDSATNQPISNATIGLVSKNLFFPANEDGQFDVTIGNEADSISISCIGYHTKSIVSREIRNLGIVKLTPMNTVLSEVKIAYHSSPLIKVGSKRRSAFGSGSIFPGYLKAVYMKGSEKAGGIIKSVGFNLGNGNILVPGRGDVTAPFRIRIFDVDTSGAPGNELTKNIIVASAKRSGWFDVDISAYKIENPEKGFFVAFCLLNSEYYIDRNGKRRHSGEGYNSGDIKSPRLGFVTNAAEESNSFTGSERKWGISWNKDDFLKGTYLIQAALALN